MAHLKSQNCVDLPNRWVNKASSLIVSKFIAVYTTFNCESNKELEIFANFNGKYFDVNYSQPDDIPSFNFNGSS